MKPSASKPVPPRQSRRFTFCWCMRCASPSTMSCSAKGEFVSRPIVIVGDSMLDVDIEGTATRLSPEAPVPVVDADRVWHRPGGAGLAAVLAARAGHGVAVVTALSYDRGGGGLEE